MENDKQLEVDALHATLVSLETEKSRVDFLLRERIKELACQNSMSELFATATIPLDDICEQIILIVLEAFQFPDVAEAELVINNQVYKSPGYRNCRKFIYQKIEVNAEVIGHLKVGYPEDQLPEANELFLKEENSLLFSICVRLSRHIEMDLYDQALKESEDKYRSLIENITDIIFRVNANQVITYISPAVMKILGYRPEEVIGRSFHEFVGENSETLNSRFEMLKKQNEIHNVYKLRSKSGEDHWIRLSTKPIIKDNQFCGGAGTIIDITEKKLAEERLEQQNERMSAILRAMPDMIYIMDKEGTYLEYYADNVDQLLAPKDKLVGMNMREIFDEEMATLHIDKIRECIQTRKILTYEYAVVNQGVLTHYEVRLILLSDEKVLRFIRDVTARKNAENEILDLNANLENKIRERTTQLARTNLELLREIEERNRVEDDLKKARQDAEDANMAKSEFLSRMSHELRTPMNSILGFAQLLEMSDLVPKQKKSVRHILHSGKILLDLINEVLDISRIEAGRLSLSIEPVLLESVIKEMVDVVYPLAKDKHITIELTDCHLTKLYVQCDRQRLKQILINLINNAIKYNKKAGLIRIKTELVPGIHQKTQRVRISIMDNGVGISTENLKKIFTPFERIGAEKSQTEGTGLGLTVVKKLVEAMGGDLGVESVLNEGSTFWFELPQVEYQQEERLPEVKEDLKTGKESCIGQVLYVEDNQPNIELVEQIFSVQRSGIRLVVSMNGRGVVKMAKENKPDLILLDLNLPDMHGSEVLERLKADKETKDIPVVVISADAMPKQLENLKNAGATDYLTKPLNIKDFLAVIDEYVFD